MTHDLFGGVVSEKRKNFSRNNLGQRRAGDFYQTPTSMTEQFLDALPIEHYPILEPACGKGAILEVLGRWYPGEAEGYDIANPHGKDFLEETRRFPTVITNPPFSLSTEFILKCKEVATWRFSLLMPIDYLHGQERYERIFSVQDDWCLVLLHIFTRRALLSGEIRDDGRYKTGMITWAWYTWLRVGPGTLAPMVYWINNDAYVLRGDR